MKMEMSEHGRRLLTKWEGFRTSVYKDAAGLPTIGVGHLLTADERAKGHIVVNGQAIKFGAGITENQVQALLIQDLRKFVSAVNDLVQVELEPNQFDAIVSFAFNVGIEAFRKSSVLRALNQNFFADIPDELRRWKNAGGVEIAGLSIRRENEIKLWFGEI
jgi:lysozyme